MILLASILFTVDTELRKKQLRVLEVSKAHTPYFTTVYSSEKLDYVDLKLRIYA